MRFVDKVTSAVFDNKITTTRCNRVYGIEDFSEEFIVDTPVIIDYVDRGWVGDITFYFDGMSTEDEWNFTDINDKFSYTNVLCIRRGINKQVDGCGIWRYTFLKY